MKLNKKSSLTILVFINFIILITPSIRAVEIPKTSQLPNILTSEPPRNEIVWTHGCYTYATHYNPWKNDTIFGLPFGIPMMYECLFGFNAVTQTLIPCIGETLIWSPDRTSFTVELNPAARWSDGEYIDSNDIVYSYELAMAQNQYIEDFTKRFADFVAVDTHTVRFDLKSNFNNSRVAEDACKYNIPIVPQHIYKDIVAKEGDPSGDLTNWDNDWMDPSFNSSWKVMSGPYCPVYRVSDNEGVDFMDIYEYRTDWWGADANLYSELENWNEDPPKFIGHKRSGLSIPQSLQFTKGEIDLYGLHHSQIWEVWENASPASPIAHINTWFGKDPPYHLAVNHLINLAPNHKHPDGIMAIKEFRQALSYAIDYDPIPDVADSGYWSRAKPGFIDNNSPFHAPYYNPNVTNLYKKNLNISKAVALLESLPGIIHELNGTWSYNGVPLGPYQMICPVGWVDSIIFTEMVCEDITENLNITISTKLVEFSTDYKAMIEEFNYDFAMVVSEPRFLIAPEKFLDSLRGIHLWNRNVTGWKNSTFEYIYDTLECAPQTAYETAIDQIQMILAVECPEIPCFVTSYWYHFNDYFWEGWPSVINDYQQICTVWTDDQWVIKTRMFLNLKAVRRVTPKIPWFGLEYFLIFGITSLIPFLNLKDKSIKKKKVKDSKFESFKYKYINKSLY